MKRAIRIGQWLVIAATLLAVSACVAVPAPTSAPETAPTAALAPSASATESTANPGAAASEFTDPFAYCAAIGTIDLPDARFTGPKVPEEIANGLQKALGLTGTPPPPVAQNSFWRCMDGKVYACTVGANLPCTEKANTDRTPSTEMAEFCKAQPDAEVIPAFVTGHNTVFEWRCKGGVPEIVKQVAETDPRGFLANIWYEIKPTEQ